MFIAIGDVYRTHIFNIILIKKCSNTVTLPMNDQRRDLEDTDEIRQITETLEHLEITSRRLRERRNTLIQQKERRRSARIQTARRASKRELKIGDLVEVKDNYKGRKGIKGRIAEFHGAQVRLEPIDGSAGFRKFKENVRLIIEE